MHKHIQVSLLPGRRTKENLAWCFLFFAGFRKGLSSENLPFISTAKKGRLSPGSHQVIFVVKVVQKDP